jgi:hypothetical protein
MAKSNSDLPRAQFVPNTARICGHSRLITQHFPLQITKPPGQSLFGFVFQAGHASSILVTRSKAMALVKDPFAMPLASA